MRRKKNQHPDNASQGFSKSDFYEKHPSRLQFWTNMILVLITLSALIINSYFSKKSLALSTEQYKSTLRQFDYLRITDSLKEQKALKQRRLDSILSTTESKAQSDRNNSQDLLNNRQLNINSKQLKATRSQAQTLKNQLDEQIKQYKEQFFERRPFFNVDNINIDSLTVKYKPNISFVFSNKGIRVAHVDSTIIAFYNLKLGCYSVTPNTANLETQVQQNNLNTSQINIYRDCLNSNNTIFFLLIYYKDFATNDARNQAVFFQYKFNAQKQFLYIPLLKSQVPIEFKSFLKKKKVVYDE